MKKLIVLCITITLTNGCKDHSTKLGWDKHQGANAYQVYMLPTDGGMFDKTNQKLTKVSLVKTNYVKVQNLPVGTWRFSVTSIDSNGNESGFSDEVEKKIK